MEALRTMTESISKAVLNYQNGLSIPGNRTAVCVSVEPIEPEAAAVLGVDCGKTYVYTDGNYDSSVSRRVGKTYAPLDEVVKTMVARQRGAVGESLQSVRDEELFACGNCLTCAIMLPARAGDIELPEWARVYVAVCDLSSTTAYARRATREGLSALKDYVGKSELNSDMYVRP